MKLSTFMLITSLSLPLLAANLGPQSPNPLDTKKKSSSSTFRLVKYFGLTVASSYGFFYLLNKNAGEPLAQQRLLAYSLGIPSAIGLGMYLGVVARFKPCTSLIT